MTNDNEDRIKMRDIRAAKMCSRGARHWFESNGFDWNDFLANGIEREKVVATGDAMGLEVVKAFDNGRK